ncbi:MAG: glycosyltransferase family 2 protein, partial [Ginsengibacter sp.]
RHENIRIISMADFTAANSINSYKKAGLEKAISVARGSLIVTTDADCIAGKKWLETIATFHLENDFVFIAAPVVIDGGSKVNHDFLSIFQALDFMTMQGITGASVAKKFHNMCNGANLAYTKQAFDIAGGFKGIDNIASGDDMLLMQKIQKLYPQKIGFLKSKDAIVFTQPAVSLLDFMNQRIRWASKSGSYKDPKITSVLFLVYLFNAWILMSMILSIFFIHFFQVVLLLFAGKILVELFFLYPVSNFFGKRQLLWWFIPAEPFHILYIILAGWLGRFGSYKWKGRRVK